MFCFPRWPHDTAWGLASLSSSLGYLRLGRVWGRRWETQPSALWVTSGQRSEGSDRPLTLTSLGALLMEGPRPSHICCSDSLTFLGSHSCGIPGLRVNLFVTPLHTLLPPTSFVRMSWLKAAYLLLQAVNCPALSRLTAGSALASSLHLELTLYSWTCTVTY